MVRCLRKDSNKKSVGIYETPGFANVSVESLSVQLQQTSYQDPSAAVFENPGYGNVDPVESAHCESTDGNPAYGGKVSDLEAQADVTNSTFKGPGSISDSLETETKKDQQTSEL